MHVIIQPDYDYVIWVNDDNARLHRLLVNFPWALLLWSSFWNCCFSKSHTLMAIGRKTAFKLTVAACFYFHILCKIKTMCYPPLSFVPSSCTEIKNYELWLDWALWDNRGSESSSREMEMAQRDCLIFLESEDFLPNICESHFALTSLKEIFFNGGRGCSTILKSMFKQ